MKRTSKMTFKLKKQKCEMCEKKTNLEDLSSFNVFRRVCKNCRERYSKKEKGGEK